MPLPALAPSKAIVPRPAPASTCPHSHSPTPPATARGCQPHNGDCRGGYRSRRLRRAGRVGGALEDRPLPNDGDEGTPWAKWGLSSPPCSPCPSAPSPPPPICYGSLPGPRESLGQRRAPTYEMPGTFCTASCTATPTHRVLLRGSQPDSPSPTAPQVLPCSKRFVHDWTECPFAHPQEKARRRDPRVHTYTGIACPSMKKVRSLGRASGGFGECCGAATPPQARLGARIRRWHNGTAGRAGLGGVSNQTS